MANYKEIVTDWANDHAEETIDGWDFYPADLVVDELAWEDLTESEEVLDAVRQRIEDLCDDPEYYGVTFPVYTSDLEEIFDAHESEAEDYAIEIYGSLSEAITGLDSMDEIKTRLAYCLVDRKVRDAFYAMESKLDELEDLLGDLA